MQGPAPSPPPGRLPCCWNCRLPTIVPSQASIYIDIPAYYDQPLRRLQGELGMNLCMYGRTVFF